MRGKILTVIIVITIIIIGIEVLLKSNYVMSSVSYSLSLWCNSVFPSLFPFFVISNLLINCGFASFLGEILKPFMHQIFKIKGEASFVLVMSMLSGFPSSAKYTRELYDKGLINEHEATKLLTFTHFSNPLFILGTISIMFLGNKEVGMLILLSHYISNIIIGIIFRNYYVSKKDTSTVSFRKAFNIMHKKRIESGKSLGLLISNALMNSINTLLLVLGVITMFLIITTIIDQNVSLNPYNQSILNGFLEMTQGLNYVGLLEIPLKNKAILSTMFISFGGLSVHMQTIGLISDSKIKYYPYLIARLLHASISGLLIYLLFDYWFLLI
jgi:sporulation integral membrane protein YlbJ